MLIVYSIQKMIKIRKTKTGEKAQVQMNNLNEVIKEFPKVNILKCMKILKWNEYSEQDEWELPSIMHTYALNDKQIHFSNLLLQIKIIKIYIYF